MINIYNRDKIHKLTENKVDKERFDTILNTKADIKDSRNNHKALEMLQNQSRHLMIVLIEMIRHESLKYSEVEESRNAKEAKLSSILKIALNIAKWMNNFNLNSEDVEKQFEIPKELQNFDCIVKKKFRNLKSTSRKKLPDITNINNLTLNAELSHKIDSKTPDRGFTISGTQTPADLKMKLPNRTAMMGYLLKNRKMAHSNLTRNSRPNLENRKSCIFILNLDSNSHDITSLRIKKGLKNRYGTNNSNNDYTNY